MKTLLFLLSSLIFAGGALPMLEKPETTADADKGVTVVFTMKDGTVKTYSYASLEEYAEKFDCESIGLEEAPDDCRYIYDDCIGAAPTCREAAELFCNCVENLEGVDPSNFKPCQ